MSSMESSKQKLRKLELKDLLFFDNLALYYLIQETPLSVLARAFLVIDPKLAGSILGILSPKQRELLHFAMSKENDGDIKKHNEAKEGLVLIAQNLYEKGMIINKGNYFYGKEKN